MSPYEYIKKAIIEGDYKYGERLPEVTLANKLNVSRTPVREALKRLSAEGLVVTLKRGMAVRSFSRSDINQIYDLRALLEGYAAAQAAHNRLDNDIKELSATNNSFEKKINTLLNEHRGTDSYKEKVKDIYLLNNEFHKQVLMASKNDHLYFLISKVMVLPLVFHSFYSYNEQEGLSSILSHNIIIKAIREGEADRAKVAMMEHIFQGRDNILRNIE